MRVVEPGEKSYMVWTDDGNEAEVLAQSGREAAEAFGEEYHKWSRGDDGKLSSARVYVQEEEGEAPVEYDIWREWFCCSSLAEEASSEDAIDLRVEPDEDDVPQLDMTVWATHGRSLG